MTDINHLEHKELHKRYNKRAIVDYFSIDTLLGTLLIGYFYDKNDLEDLEIDISLVNLCEFGDENKLVKQRKVKTDSEGEEYQHYDYVGDYESFFLEVTNGQIQAFLNEYLND